MPVIDAPPDANPMTFGEHANAILAIMSSRPLSQHERMQAGAMIQGIMKLAQAEQQAAVGGQGQQPPGALSTTPPNATSDYGSGAGTPIPEDRYR